MQVEKTAFISYRRSNIYMARAVYQDLIHNGYDVFLDYESIDTGAFEQIIFNQIAARAHFIVVLTPSALERCSDPNDWLRREIEHALKMKRNIVPLMFEGFSFGDMKKYLMDDLLALPQYNVLNIPSDYFDEAMTRLRTRFLNKSLDVILHPIPKADKAAVLRAKEKEAAVPLVEEQYFIAEQSMERGLMLSDNSDREIACYTEAILLSPEFILPYRNRGITYYLRGQMEAAIADFTRAIELKYPDLYWPYIDRGEALVVQRKYDEALRDFTKANELKPGFNQTLAGLAITNHALGNVGRAKRLWKQLVTTDERYMDATWVENELSWVEELVDKARKLIAELG